MHLPPASASDVLFRRSREIAVELASESEVHIRHDRNPSPRRFEWQVNDEIDRLLKAAYRDESPVLLRGLYKLLLAVEMRRFPHLVEEMALSAIISREAAFELIRRKLSSNLSKRLKKADVLREIRRSFPTGDAFADVLEMDWENRNMIVHPVSEFGEFWSPMFEYEECTDTLSSLIYLYRYLLLDEVWDPDDNAESAKEQRGGDEGGAAVAPNGEDREE